MPADRYLEGIFVCFSSMQNLIALGNPNQSEHNLNFNCSGWNGTNINNTPPCFLAAKARVCGLPNWVFLAGVFSPEQQTESTVVMEASGVHDCGVCIVATVWRTTHSSLTPGHFQRLFTLSITFLLRRCMLQLSEALKGTDRYTLGEN